MSRSKWKVPISFSKNSNMIFPVDVSASSNIYNGKVWKHVKIRQPMVGHRMGEFSRYQKFGVLKKKDVRKR